MFDSSDELIQNFHSKMADFYKTEASRTKSEMLAKLQHLETVYHRYRAQERASVMNELWSQEGVRSFSVFQRSTIFNSLRCGQMLTPRTVGVDGKEQVSSRHSG